MLWYLVAALVRCRVDIARMDRRTSEREAEGNAEMAAWLVARGVTP